MWKILTRFTLLVVSMLIGSHVALADEQHQQHYKSKYQGQENRKIKSLSDDDISQLQKGQGWGLAKVAELNGMPGPIHLLEMKKEINLTDEQVNKITGIYDVMKERAQAYGEKLIKLETELNKEFVNKTITDTKLRQLLADISETHRELRYIHLSAHLSTPALLSESQLFQYNTLRGYNISDPCSQTPKGHDATMWKKHNGCS